MMKIDWSVVTDDEIALTIQRDDEHIQDYRKAILVTQEHARPFRDERKKRRMAAAAQKRAAADTRVRCKKWAESDYQCKRKTDALSGFCGQHDPATPRCRARDCWRVIPRRLEGGRFCGTHDPDSCASSYCKSTRMTNSKFCPRHTSDTASLQVSVADSDTVLQSEYVELED